MKTDDILFDLLNELFQYKDGLLIRRKSVHGVRSKKGDIAGSPVSGGYVNICINQRKYRAHRLIWMMFHGVFPDGEIDHINGIRSDNRIENLREVSRVENSRNQQIRSNNKSGVTGVCYNRGREKWEAYIKVEYKKKNLGLYDSMEEAVSARKQAEQEEGFHENHGRGPVNNGDIVVRNLGRRA